MAESAKTRFHICGLVQHADASVRHPFVISDPSGILRHYVASHDCPSGQKPEQADLGDAAEVYAVVQIQSLVPRASNVVVDVAGIRQSEPDVHIREKGRLPQFWHCRCRGVRGASRERSEETQA